MSKERWAIAICLLECGGDDDGDGDGDGVSEISDIDHDVSQGRDVDQSVDE